MGESVAFVAVGSNMEPIESIVAALTLLREEVRVRASSTFYRTEPLGGRHQPAFVNGVWRIESSLNPRRIKSNLLGRVEQRLGRVRTDDKFAPRTIDLDLVLYNDFVIDDGELVLPHPDLSRPFVHAPIIELLDEAADQIDAQLLTAIRALLPKQETPRAVPREPLPDLTNRLRRLLV